MAKKQIKKNIGGETHETYRIEAGVPSSNKDLGECYYKLTCGDADGFGFYEDGSHMLRARRVSIEKVGSDVSATQKSHNDVDTFSPSKVILAESGDIFFEAKGGDIILKGNNIILRADGSEKKEGHIFMTANNTIGVLGSRIDIKSQGSFKVDAKTGLSIRGGSTLIGGVSVDIKEGVTPQIGSQIASLLSGGLFDPQKFLEIFTDFLKTD